MKRRSDDGRRRAQALFIAASLLIAAALPAAIPAAAAEPMPENTAYVDPALDMNAKSTGIEFGGKTYHVQVGLQGFRTVKEALDSISPGGTVWLAPATYTEGVTITKNCTILGPKAGIDPNVRGAAATDDWTRSPDRGTGEAVLATSWHMGVNQNTKLVYDCTEITVDGMQVGQGGMFRSNFAEKGSIKLTYRNMLVSGYNTANNGPFYCYSYYPDRKTNNYARDVVCENIRFEGMTTAPGFNLTVESFLAKGVYFDGASTKHALDFVSSCSPSVSRGPVSATFEDCMFRQKTSQIIGLDFSTTAGGHGLNAGVGEKESVTGTVRNCVFADNAEGELGEDRLIIRKSDTPNVRFVIENNTYFVTPPATTEKPDAMTYDLKTEVKLLGRTYFEGSRLFFNWSGSGVEFCFTGSGAKATIGSSAPAGDHTAYIKIWVDGKEMPDVKLTAVSQEVTLASGLDANAKHTVRLIKRTNARSSSAFIAQLKLTDGKKEAPPAAKERLIEFVGDSLTVGYASIARDVGATAWSTATEDVSKTYVPAVAEALGADWSVVAVSGRGVVRNQGNETSRTMPILYPLLDDYNATGVPYGFERQADVIVINLGTNDASGTVSGLTPDEFEAGVYNFIKDVRRLNPKAEIIWSYGLTKVTYQKQMKNAIEKINAEGDTHVSFYRLQTCTDAELALGHPTAEAYASRVEGLVNAIKAATGWDGGAIADTVVTDDPGRTEDITTDAPGTSDSGDSSAGGCSSAAGTAAAAAAAAAAATFGKKLTGRGKRKKEKDAD